MKRNLWKCLAGGLAMGMLLQCGLPVRAAAEKTVTITVQTEEQLGEISPYIYGVNVDFASTGANFTAIREGGNRMTGYNWETNLSNAGSDWNHSSDNFYMNKVHRTLRMSPGAPSLSISQKAEPFNAFTLTTLQMAGYVVSLKQGEVQPEDSAPSEYWDEVVFRKDGEFTLTPDKKDGVVYMDEYVNYLVQTLGDSTTPNGIKAYSLDNEPTLWPSTHPRIHSEQLTHAELMERSVALSSAVKDVDPNALIFGPVLYGFGAYNDLSGAPDWKELQQENGYFWYIDAYLDAMRKAEEEQGRRLVDVLDIHYYTEACGECGQRSCNHYDNPNCVNAKLQSPRTLWDSTYREDSWIGQWFSQYLPILPNVNKSIEQYYPGTKLAITEYDFGSGDNVVGAIVQSDALGVFAENNVYAAFLFCGSGAYQASAINMYTNYDGNGAAFGDRLVASQSSDFETVTVCASRHSNDENTLNLIANNKSYAEPVQAQVQVDGFDGGKAAVYAITGDSSDIVLLEEGIAVENGGFAYELPALSVVQFVVTK